jgi:hypothetical protein
MKKHLLLLPVVLFCLALPWTVSAQDSTRHRLAFFRDPHPALLFSVAGLDLGKFDGGIGLALKGNDSYFWRFSFDLDFRGDVNRRQYRSQQSDSHAETFFLSFAPVFLLSDISPGFLFASPCLQISFNQSRSTYSYTDSLATYVSSSYGKHWNGLGGVSVGIGYPISDKMLLTGEYRYFIAVSMYPATGYSSTETKSWDAGSQVLLTLCCKF